MKPSIWIGLLFCLLLNCCKKDSSSGQNLVEFDLDGVHYSLTPTQATVTVDTLSDGIFKIVEIGGSIAPGKNFVLGLSEDISNRADDCILTGAYPGIFYANLCSDSIARNCRNFSCVYDDFNVGVFGNQVYDDSLSSLSISSCSGSPATIDGTFQTELIDMLGGGSSNKYVTNGVIRGVTYIRQ